MSRLRDHRVRMDASWCPDSAGCARLYHPSLKSGLGPGDICECCGQAIPPVGGEDESAPDDGMRVWITVGHD